MPWSCPQPQPETSHEDAVNPADGEGARAPVGLPMAQAQRAGFDEQQV